MPDSRKLRVFLCHASQDKPVVRELYQRLLAEGWIDPWLDEEKLLPGQDWDLEIEKAVEIADTIIVCLTNTSVTKEGYVQKEMRFALNVALYKPEGSIYVIPMRLDECSIPRNLRNIQFIDFFPIERKEWAYQRLIQALKIRSKEEIKSSDVKKDVVQRDVIEKFTQEQTKDEPQKELEIKSYVAEINEKETRVKENNNVSFLETESLSRQNYFAPSNIILSSISFLADLLALIQIAYNIIAGKDIGNLSLQFTAIVLVFLLGLGLGNIGLRGRHRDTAQSLMKVFIWGYLIVACFSYLGVMIVFRDPFTLPSYISYLLIIGLPLVAFILLQQFANVRPLVAHAISLLTVSIIHALVFLYRFIFIAVPEIFQVLGEWFIWVAWTIFAISLLQRSFSSRKMSK